MKRRLHFIAKLRHAVASDGLGGGMPVQAETATFTARLGENLAAILSAGSPAPDVPAAVNGIIWHALFDKLPYDGPL